MSPNGVSSASFPMPRHQLPPSVTQRTQHFGDHLSQLKANGLPRSGLSPSAATGTGKNMAGAASQRLLNLGH